MDTPICDFVQNYKNKNMLRLHMPGHKGISALGCEPYDITEIPGADSLYESDGVIRRSELNAGSLFGARTYYSTEGSSLCIKAMLYMACVCGKRSGDRPVIFAGRNAHKSFVNGAALMDIDVCWIHGASDDGYLSCHISAQELDDMLSQTEHLPIAVYITSPDYIGNMADVGAISKVCRKYGVMLLVDSAHGAYLKFLDTSLHPIDLGADMCCDSAHKTLPVITGGAYLHVSHSASKSCADMAKTAMGLFGSTSPSYLIMQSLDMANRYLSDGYSEKLADFVPKAAQLKDKLEAMGYTFCGSEPLKLTIASKAYGYTGIQLVAELEKHNLVCEFADSDFAVMMLSPEIGDTGIDSIYNAMSCIPRKNAIDIPAPKLPRPERAMTIREAMMSQSKLIPSSECEGRILASSNTACPPAVPIVVCGERIDKAAIECFRYYGIEKCLVVE